MDRRRRCPRIFRMMAGLSALVFGAVAATAQAPALISVDGAKPIFRQAQDICQRDGGRLWGRSLCGPIMLVDPRGRRVVANQLDTGAILHADGGYFTGVLPASENVANTATPWSGTFWTQISWPLPDDSLARGTLIAHELFHRIASRLDLPILHQGDNHHLDTFSGRYLLQLEWRALAAALSATSDTARKRAVKDALIFRAERYSIFPHAEADEEALEINEGLAEYTGIRLGITDAALRVKAAIGEFRAHDDDDTFVRSFAYTTGPAYGLLLDRYAPSWRVKIRKQPRLGALLARAAGIELPQDVHQLTDERAQVYDGPTLRAAEMGRETKRQHVLVAYRKKFVEGPIVRVPLAHMSFQFNPTNLQPLDELGTVYPTIRITDSWGILEAKSGALLSQKFDAVTVAGPATISGNKLTGDGWTIDLNRGWSVAAGARQGDIIIKAPPV